MLEFAAGLGDLGLGAGDDVPGVARGAARPARVRPRGRRRRGRRGPAWRWRGSWRPRRRGTRRLRPRGDGAGLGQAGRAASCSAAGSSVRPASFWASPASSLARVSARRRASEARSRFAEVSSDSARRCSATVSASSRSAGGRTTGVATLKVVGDAGLEARLLVGERGRVLAQLLARGLGGDERGARLDVPLEADARGGEIADAGLVAQGWRGRPRRSSSLARSSRSLRAGGEGDAQDAFGLDDEGVGEAADEGSGEGGFGAGFGNQGEGVGGAGAGPRGGWRRPARPAAPKRSPARSLPPAEPSAASASGTDTVTAVLPQPLNPHRRRRDLDRGPRVAHAAVGPVDGLDRAVVDLCRGGLGLREPPPRGRPRRGLRGPLGPAPARGRRASSGSRRRPPGSGAAPGGALRRRRGASPRRRSRRFVGRGAELGVRGDLLAERLAARPRSRSRSAPAPAAPPIAPGRQLRVARGPLHQGRRPRRGVPAGSPRPWRAG